MPDTLLAPHRFPAQARRSLAADDRHFRHIRAALAERVEDLTRRRAELRLVSGMEGDGMLRRDDEIKHLSRQLVLIERLGQEPCLGRFDTDDETSVYVGRLGVRADDGRQLLVDWRTDAAAPFFAATLQERLGVVRRRRFRWLDGQVVEAWDEWLDLTRDQEETGLQDAQSAFLAGLAAQRTGRMASVLATIQADQDEVIRANPAACVVVDGGPGTGKTVVALHRAAYVAFTRQATVLYVTKSDRLTGYVRDVLPSLGEDEVPVATLDQLYETAATRPAGPAEAQRLKGSLAMTEAIDRAVAFYESLPDQTVIAELPDRDVAVRPAQWQEALQSCSEPQHGPRRTELLLALSELLDEPRLRRDPLVRSTLQQSWPDLTPEQLIGDLLGHRALLRHCTPHLDERSRALLHSGPGAGWAPEDLPLLDYARQRLGAPPVDGALVAELARQRSQAKAALLTAQAHATPGTGVEMLSERDAVLLAPEEELRERSLHGRLFAHVVVDEAQELTPMEWQVVLARCPGRSLTVVGDRAQSRLPFDESWLDRMASVGVARSEVHRLSTDYRTPRSLMEPAAAVILAARPGIGVPESVRTDGEPLLVEHVNGDLLTTAVDRATAMLAAGGTAAVVVHPSRPEVTLPPGATRYQPDELQGLEMDVVVIVEPAELWTDTESSAASLYVTLTRATRAVIVLHSQPLPACFEPALTAVT